MSDDQNKPESVPQKNGIPPPAHKLTPPKADVVSEAAKNQTAPIVLPGMNEAFPPRRPRPPHAPMQQQRPPQSAAPAQHISPPSEGAPKTIQLKRPSGAIRLPQDPAQPGTPRTIRLSRQPGAQPPSITPAHPKTLSEAAKNTTARIVLDAGEPEQTQQKLKPPTRIAPATVEPASRDKTSRIVLQSTASTAQKTTPPATRIGLIKPQADMLDEAAKNKTIRVDLTDSEPPFSLKPKTGASAMTPEIVGADTVVASSLGPISKKSTTRVIDLPSSEPGKRTTSRIILENLQPTSPATAKRSTAPITAPPTGPKTIRLKRPTGAITVPAEQQQDVASTVKTIRLAKPGVPAAATPGKPRKETATIQPESADTQIESPKRSTARIETHEDDASQPATIRLRRPSTIAAVAPTTVQQQKTPKTETTRIEIVPSAEQPPLTQRRTLQLRKPVLEKDADAETAQAEDEAKEKSDTFRPADIIPDKDRLRRKEKEEDEETSIHVTFSVLSVVAVLVLCMVAYVLAAQAFAPDFTLPIPAFLL